MKKQKPIDLAIKATGSQSDLAKKLDVSIQVVHNMKARGKISTKKIQPSKWVETTGLSYAVLFPEYHGK